MVLLEVYAIVIITIALQLVHGMAPAVKITKNGV